MRKLILEEWTSLDGFAEDKNGKLDFFPTTEENKYADQKQLEFLKTIDTILLGRNTYELFAGFWPTVSANEEIVADKLNGLKKIVFSSTLKDAPWGKWPAADVNSGDAVAEIKKLKNLPGKDMVLWGSISLVQTLIENNLVDEYRLNICPVIVGGGRRLFPESKEYAKLQLVERREYESGVVFLKYDLFNQ